MRYYGNVKTAFAPILNTPTKAGMLSQIQALLERGTSPVSVNTWLRGFKAYTRWLKEEGHLGEALKVQFLKTEQKILSTLSKEDVQRIVGFRPRGINLTRAHLIALTILDTGLRASEVLGLTKENVDVDNLTLKVVGKGNKRRVVPFSFQLRKSLYRHHRDDEKRSARFLFGTQNKTPLTVRNLERDFKVLGEECGIAGIRFSPHTLRHTFAVMYLRAGGNLEFLRRILGHSSILTTQKYLKSLGVEDLGAVHNDLSPLSARR
jgi:integrase/recombinase XerD